MLQCVKLGLSMQDLESLTVGMIYDMFITWNNAKAEEETEEREATQADIDSFFG